jgi:hypothetical protein
MYFMDNLIRQVKVLRLFVIVLTVLVLACIITLFALIRGSHDFTELTARRINIVEPDGRLALVISNHANQHPGAMDGKDLPARDRPAGMIFFNEEGDECGGLVYDGTKKEASFTWSVDQYKNDQIMQLQYQQDSGRRLSRSYGFKLWDRSDRFTLGQELDFFNSLPKNDTAALTAGIDSLRKKGFLGVERLFLGRTTDGETGLFLRDDRGVPRLRICIGKQNEPVVETLDERGNIIGRMR